MRSVYFALALSASLFFCNSCSNDAADSLENDVKIEKTFGISSIDSETRTVISGINPTAGTYGVDWQTTDKVSVFAEGHSVGDVFRFVEFDSEQYRSAQFKGMTYNKTKFWALYPAQQDARLIDDNLLQFTIPNKQKAVNGSFDPAAGIQIGHVETATGDIGLKSVCSYFEITVSSNCHSITIESKQDTDGEKWYLAGTVKADAKSAGAPIQEFVNCVSEIELTDIPQEGGTFYVAFIPSTKLPGLDFYLNYEAGTIHLDLEPKTPGNKFQFLANHIYPIKLTNGDE